MGSLIEELRRREAAARAEADRLRTRIEELAEDLARAEEQVTRLAIAREEVTRVLEEPAAAVPPAGQDGETSRPGPKARAKWLAGSVRKDPAEVIAAAFDEAEARDPGHLRAWVVLVDGAQHQLSLIRAEAAHRGVAVHIVIDIIHVIDYIWGAVWSFREAGDPAAEDWGAARALAVLAGDSDRAAQEIAAEADVAGLEGKQRAGADACVRYLGNRRKFLRYGQALEAGWPIASGVIEGACRHLIADRLSLSGARWGLDGAEAVLTLRAVISNGDFEEYWRFHLEREHQRLYPGVNQRQYTLGT